MKVVSWKTFLSTVVIGGGAIVYKVIHFDGLTDLFWIVLFGYLTIKGLTVALSQEAYDEDVKQALQGRVLYRDLFGRFAYIVADIPILTILLAGLLAAVCPATTLLLVVLLILLAIALVYAVWFSWYVSKHKRLRVESGAWGEGTLSAADEQAWKRYDRWHTIGRGVIAVMIILYLIFGDPRIHINNSKLEDALTGLDTGSVTLEEVVPFEWTTVYTFDPYTSIDRIEWITGSKSPALKESVSEGMTHVVFMDHGQVAASVCAYPSNIGYSLAFTGGENTHYDYTDGGYSHIEYGDGTVFEVTQEDGFVRLFAQVKES